MSRTVLVLLLVVLVAVSVAGARQAPKKTGRFHGKKPAMHPDIIAAVNSNPDATWEAGVNSKFEGMTLSEVKRFLGAKKGGRQLPLKEYSDEENAAVPASFDARTQWGKNCTGLNEVRDQSSCGSCWAFGAAEAMTDRLCISTGGKTQTHLSAADLMSCCIDCGDGCDGGYPTSAWDYWVQTGLVSGGNYSNTTVDNGCFPYPFPPCEHHIPAGHYPACPSDEYVAPDCPNKCSNKATWKTDKVHGKSAYMVDVDSIKADLVQYGPQEVAFDVYEDFLTYKSGVYQHLTGEYLGGHAVKLIGYGTEDGVDYWTIINSWNSDWGDGGQFKILAGTDECGIEDEVVAGTY